MKWRSAHMTSSLCLQFSSRYRAFRQPMHRLRDLKRPSIADRMASGMYQPPAVKPPNTKQLSKIAARLGLDIADDELKEYKEVITTSLEYFGRLEELEEPTLPVKYPRKPGYRPKKEDNLYNAWLCKTDIIGASEGKLHGKTIALKDNIAVAGVEMTYGSRQLEGYIPDYDATVVTRLLDAGARITGKANCEEYCYSGASFTCAFGPVQNPRKTGYSAGGSSCGSAALVAAGEVDLALGADQGGSIRIPSASCGVVGLKPTRGLVPYSGIMSMDASLDHVGPIAKSVRDCALLLEVIAGNDALDHRQPTTVEVPQYVNLLSARLDGVRIGVLSEGFVDCEPYIEQTVRTTCDIGLMAIGATVQDISIPMHAYGPYILHAIVSYGSYTTLQQSGCNIGVKGFTPTHTHQACMRGWNSMAANNMAPTMTTQCLMCEYLKDYCGPRFYSKAQNLAGSLKKAYDEALRTCDVIVMPTLLARPLPLPKANLSIKEYMNQALGTTANTSPFDASGHPALTINVGTSEDLPIGMMIVGRYFDETTVLKVAFACEQLKMDS